MYYTYQGLSAYAASKHFLIDSWVSTSNMQYFFKIILLINAKQVWNYY